MAEGLQSDTEAYLARIRKTIADSERLVEAARLRIAETDRMLEKQGLTREQVMNFRFSPEQREAVNRELAMKVFSLKALTIEDKKLLDYYVMSGTYGNIENALKNSIKYRGKGSKLGYMLYRLFPPMSFLEVSVPWVKKSKLLIPPAYIYRFYRCVTSSKKDVKREVKQLEKL